MAQLTTREHRWRTVNTSAKYVDSRFGSDEWGDGSREKPYQTITWAYANQSNKPGMVVCRGVFSDSIVGNHVCQLVADYYGAAVWNGKGANTIPWMGAYHRWIFVNGGEEVADADASTVDAYKALCGLGRADHASAVYRANAVYGFASSPVLVHNSKLWRGGCGGSSPTRIIYSSIVRNSGCGVVLSNYAGYQSTYCTYYNTRIDTVENNIVRRGTGSVMGRHNGKRCIYSKWDFFIAGTENSRDYFAECCFASDCRYFINYKFENTAANWQVLWEDSNEAESVSYTYDSENKTVTVILPAEEGVTHNISHVVPALVTLGLVTESYSMQFATGDSANVFTDQTAYDIFNNPDNLDFTLKPTAACVFPERNLYYGALPPSTHIAVYGNTENVRTASDGQLWCFDNRTLTGCLKVENKAIKIDTASNATSGAIYSKILRVNPLELQYNAVYALNSDHITTDKIVMNTESYTSDVYPVDTDLPVGKYLIRPSDDADDDIIGTYYNPTYGEQNTVRMNSVIFVTQDAVNNGYNQIHVDSTYSGTIYAHYLVEPNSQNVVYCRCRSSIYATAKSGDTLVSGVTYYNKGDKNITFNARTVIPGESFVADANAVFTCAEDSNYEIAVMFDDRTDEEIQNAGSQRAVPKVSWTPANTRGEYFVLKNNGVINNSTVNDQPLGSGNPYTYKQDGSLTSGSKSPLDQPYMQFAVFVTKGG